MSLADFEKRLAALESMTAQMVRLGKVVATDPAKATVRVRIVDAFNMVTASLPVVTRKAAEDKDYWMPDIGDQAVCLFRGTGLEDGVCLGVIFSGPSPVPVASQDKRHISFKDGTWLEYDRAAGHLTASVRGDVYIEADRGITVRQAQSIEVNSDTAVMVNCQTSEVNAAVSALVKSPSVDLGGLGGTGLVTQECFCSLTGYPHPEASQVVRAVKVGGA